MFFAIIVFLLLCDGLWPVSVTFPDHTPLFVLHVRYRMFVSYLNAICSAGVYNTLA